MESLTWNGIVRNELLMGRWFNLKYVNLPLDVEVNVNLPLYMKVDVDMPLR